MRNNLKKIIDGAEAALIMLFWCVLWIFLSPIAAFRWFFALCCSTYTYCKIPELTFYECLRWEMTETAYHDEPSKFDIFYFPKKPFDLDEYKRVSRIIRSSWHSQK